MAIIYKITNIVNGRIYIGFTVQSIQQRWWGHLSDVNSGSKLKIHNAIRKYGKENFSIEEIYSSEDKEYTHNVMEEFFIKQYDSVNRGYNLTYGGEHHNPNEKSKWYNNGKEERMFKNIIPDGYVRGRIFPEGSKKTQFKIGKNNFGCNNGMFGKILSKEHRKKISETSRKNYGEERKIKQSERISGINNPCYGSTYVWINNKIKNNRHDKQLPIPKGWELGMIKRNT